MIPWARIAKVALPIGRWLVFEGLGLIEKLRAKPKSPVELARELDEKARADRSVTKTVVLPRRKP
jgi:hypothetical protein